MKKFWKTVAAVVVGILLCNIIGIFFWLSFIGSLGSLGSSTTVTEVPANAILNIDMSKLIVAEQTLENDPFSSLSSFSTADMEIRTIGMLDAVRALESAAADPNIRCVYIRPEAAADLSHLEEFRSALGNFRKSGKPVYAYMESATNAGFYLASVADRIYLSSYHGGMVGLVGLSGQILYFKDLLDMLGVNVQLIRHGKYKSAGEPYVRSTASKENLEQQRVMIDGLWKEMISAMASRTEISEDELNELIDDLELRSADDFLKHGLVDELVTMESMKNKLCAMTGAAKYSEVKSISLYDYAALRVKDDLRAADAIAIIYADGEIVDGRDAKEVAGKRFADLVNEARKDASVKAVVLRVNSPGGSVVAASQIKEAIDSLRKDKPVIASYGSYAASGGYWISANTDYIFSDATTLTGSIGVFGMIPEFSTAIKKHGHINVYSVNSNEHSDMYRSMRAFTDDEIEYIQYDIEAIYNEFTSLVAKGRNMSVERVDELGQGRVWTGRDALERGLVDEIGGLKDALDYTATKAGLTSYRIVSYPKPMTAIEIMMASFSDNGAEYLIEGLHLPEAALEAARQISKIGEPAIYARLPYMLDVK